MKSHDQLHIFGRGGYCSYIYYIEQFVQRHYSQVVTAVDSNSFDYQLLFEGAGSNPAGVVLLLSSMQQTQPIFWIQTQMEHIK
jgi:hypothetical protein